MKEKKQYYRRLDVIRNISCIMVLLYHLNILKGGFLAVCTFFALSGYLTGMSALKKEKFSIKTYYLNRLKTLYLPLIVVLSLTIIVFKLLPNITWLNLKQETTSVIFGYNNFWQLNANLDYFTKNVNSPFIHLWYISILMQFELVFPIIFKIFKKIQEKSMNNIPIIITFLLTIASTVLFIYMSITKDIMVVYYNTFARVFSILFGVLIALVYNEYGIRFPKKLKTNNSFIFLIYIIIFILLSIFVSAESKLFAVFMIITTIISIRLIKYSTIITKHPYKFEKLNKILAKSSYEIYLVQYPIIFFMQGLPINPVLKTVLIIILTFLISCIISIMIGFKTKNKIFKSLKIALLSLIIIFGAFLLITEKDHTDEMKELEAVLNENANLTEQKNEQFLNDENTEKQKEADKKESNNENTIEVSISQKTQNNTEGTNAKEQTTTISKAKEEQAAEQVKNLPVVGIGDSVLLGAINELYKKFPNGYFDGKVSRSLSAGETILKDLKSKGKLTDTVILALANNGDYSTKKNVQLMEIVGDRQVYWINAVGADDPTFNAKFKEFAKDYPNLHIVEWDVVSKGHKEYFYADGIHTKGEGLKKYAETVYEAVYNDYLNK